MDKNLHEQWSQLPKVFERRELDKGVPTTLQVTAT